MFIILPRDLFKLAVHLQCMVGMQRNCFAESEENRVKKL